MEPTPDLLCTESLDDAAATASSVSGRRDALIEQFEAGHATLCRSDIPQPSFGDFVALAAEIRRLTTLL